LRPQYTGGIVNAIRSPDRGRGKTSGGMNGDSGPEGTNEGEVQGGSSIDTTTAGPSPTIPSDPSTDTTVGPSPTVSSNPNRSKSESPTRTSTGSVSTKETRRVLTSFISQSLSVDLALVQDSPSLPTDQLMDLPMEPTH
jgi:hypothetical protein